MALHLQHRTQYLMRLSFGRRAGCRENLATVYEVSRSGILRFFMLQASNRH